MMHRRLSFGGALLLFVLAPAAARAEEPEPAPSAEGDMRADAGAPPAPRAGREEPRLGRAGAVVVENVFGASFGGALVPTLASVGWLSVGEATIRARPADGVALDSSSTTFALTPSMDVFVTSRVTLGGDLVLARSTLDGGAGGATTSTYLVAPRVGWLVPLADELWLWPRGSAGLGYVDTPASGGVVARAAFEVALALALSRHAFVALGPELLYEWEGDARDGRSFTAASLGVRGGLALVF